MAVRPHPPAPTPTAAQRRAAVIWSWVETAGAVGFLLGGAMAMGTGTWVMVTNDARLLPVFGAGITGVVVGCVVYAWRAPHHPRS